MLNILKKLFGSQPQSAKSKFNIKMHFLGAARNVTGSRHVMEVDGTKVMIDCGMYQERHLRDRNWEPLAVDPSSIDAVLLTHAHLDHCGWLPKLVKDGFAGTIYCTQATAELAKIILLDSAKIQEEDVEHKRKRHKKRGTEPKYPLEPMYTIKDAESVFPLFRHVAYREAMQINEAVEFTFYDAGHVLGSSIIRVKVRFDGEERIIMFSGDLGCPGRPILSDPTVFDKADYVFVESTYGDRDHLRESKIAEDLAKIVNETVAKGGNIVIPSFALERSQELLFHLNELTQSGAIPKLQVYLDSPMASRITKVFKKHPELFDKRMKESVTNHESIFDMKNLHLAGSAKESKAINDIRKPVIIIAGSGMCTGGRIKYHLIENITRPESTLLFVGYQAVGTLGRLILEKPDQVRILGHMYDLKARVERIHGFSAHAGREELVNWLEGMKEKPRKIFVVHGEEKSALAFGEYLRNKNGWSVEVPEYGTQVVLD